MVGAVAFFTDQPQIDPEIEELRAKHKMALENSPFKETKTLPREERKKLGIPPNAYNEEVWELTMDPNLGRPAPERLWEVQMSLKRERDNNRGVGGDNNNPWVDRGPNNVGGRTRGIMFDPNDGTNRKVFAGGVSGGLWTNNDITSAVSTWNLVAGVPGNISVNVIISDPNNSNTFYIGTGESYTSGAAAGRGVWKSTDGGVTWANVWGGWTSTTINANPASDFVNGVFYINDMVARDNGGSTELYIAVAGAFLGSTNNINGGDLQFMGLNEQGVYRSTDGLATAPTKITINEGGTFPVNPNDLELDISNNIWMSSTRSSWGFNGGKIYQSTNGTTWNLINTIPNVNRLEIEPSPNNVNTFYALAESSLAFPGPVDIYTTTNAWTSFSQILTEPQDVDLQIPNTDFTRGQAFYDLVIEAYGSTNDTIQVGGIDLFLSEDQASTWTQTSKWSNNNNLAGLGVSLVHADQHTILQRPGTTKEFVYGTDGGLFYTADITVAGSSTTAITSRNNDYNTVQFYSGDISSVINGPNDDLIGGTQDNGTQAVYDAIAGANGFFDCCGGDGGYTEIDDLGTYIITAYPNNNHFAIVPPASFYQISSGIGGNFINIGALDKNLDVLFTNATTGATNQIERITNITTVPAQVQFTNALLTDAPSAMKVSPYTGASSKLFVGTRNGRLLRVDNADTAPAWTDITGGSFLGSISDIEFGQNESEIFVTMHNYGVTSIWFTSNGGTSWVSKDGDLPDLPVKCILQNPLIPGELIVGTELGVWATGDYTQGSPSWVQSYNGMSDVTVLDLDLRASDNVILATTHGRGMFTSQFTSTPLSVNDTVFDENTIVFYPTVSDGKFTMKNHRALGEVTFGLYDLTGKLVYEDKFDQSGSTTRDFDLNLNSGLYIVKIRSNNSSITKRIIIK